MRHFSFLLAFLGRCCVFLFITKSFMTEAIAEALPWEAISVGISLLAGLLGGIASCWSYRNSSRMTNLEFSHRTKLAKMHIDSEEKRREKDRKRAARELRDQVLAPLVHACFELQSRLYNICQQNFLAVLDLSDSMRDRDYAVEHTLYVFGQFLAYQEIVRRSVRALRLDEESETQHLNSLLARTAHVLLNNVLGDEFMIWRGEQRAIGEIMIVELSNGDLSALAYSTFVEKLPSMNRWFSPLRADLLALASDVTPAKPRLIRLQHALVDLIEFLDPKGSIVHRIHKDLRIPGPVPNPPLGIVDKTGESSVITGKKPLPLRSSGVVDRSEYSVQASNGSPAVSSPTHPNRAEPTDANEMPMLTLTRSKTISMATMTPANLRASRATSNDGVTSSALPVVKVMSIHPAAAVEEVDNESIASDKTDVVNPEEEEDENNFIAANQVH